MHIEHKCLRWIVAILSLMITVGVCTAVYFQDNDRNIDSAEVMAAAYMPEEMAALSNTEMPEMTAENGEMPEAQSQNEEKTAEADAEGLTEITVKADGNVMHLASAYVTVGDMLRLYNIPLGEDDIITPAADQQITDGMEITVQRITYEEVVEEEKIPFKTETKGTDKLPAGTSKVVQEGQEGQDKVTYKITYADGEEIDRKEIGRETVKKPVKEIIERSTVGTIKGKEYSRKFTVKAYSYTGGGRTASGLPAAVGRIAVDPRVIPLGTKVYVEGYGFATAADTGGNIKGNTIDVYYNSTGQCRSWGCRHVTIYILK